MRNKLFWRNSMSILNYVLADKEKKARLREGYADVLKRSNTYRLGAGIGNLAGDAVTGVRDFASDITFNPLPYDEYARSAYDGMQNLYGNALDEGLARVGDFFDRSPPTMTGGPMSRNGYRHHPGGYVIPANASLTPEAQAYRDRPALGNPHAQVTIDNTPSHLIPGFGRMVNEGYDSWSPSDGFLEGATEVVQQDTRSDWQKWKDSVSGGY